MKKRKSLRRRWLLNTVGIVFILGLVCVMLITVLYAVSCYSGTRSEMEKSAAGTAEFFSVYLNQSYEEYSRSCSTYARSFDDSDGIELQFLNTQGQLVASSGGHWVESFSTPEIGTAISSRGIRPFVGKDPHSGEGVMAVSAAMIYSNGEVVGVMRYVTSTGRMNWQIALVALCSLGVLLAVMAAVWIVNSLCIRSILSPLEQITEKAKRIAGGTYGIQIKTKHDDEIGELAKTVNELSTQISRNEKTQTEFISSLSHELRTPLTAITGWSETLLSDESLDPDSQRGVKIISKEAKRLTEMVVDLLDFTRIQDGRMTLNMELADIRSEFEDTVFMYSSRLAQDEIKLDYLENDEEIPEITCDPKRLRQVFLNILDNAAKHGGDGKRIEASMHYEDAMVVVRIRDFGPGIPEDEIPLVKKKFYKGSSKARGSGIGLAVSDEIIQMHRGELILSNAEGGGTLVTVQLPAAQ